MPKPKVLMILPAKLPIGIWVYFWTLNPIALIYTTTLNARTTLLITVAC